MRSIRCVAGGIKVGEGWGGGRPWEGPGRMMSMAARMGGSERSSSDSAGGVV